MILGKSQKSKWHASDNYEEPRVDNKSVDGVPTEIASMRQVQSEVRGWEERLTLS